MNITNDSRNMIIKHCVKCDTVLKENHFLEWLNILEAGNRIQLSDDKPFLDVEYVQGELNCPSCIKKELFRTLTMVVFKWGEEE